MKLTILFTGKTNFDFIEKGVTMYADRIKRYTAFDLKYTKDIKTGKNIPVNVYKNKETEQILKYIKANDTLVLLDEKGKMFSSLNFAEFLNHKIEIATKHLIFLIGGAYGFSDEIYARADEKISLSKMTFSHQPVRLLFAEQLYRAYTIIKGEPYHNE
jgi:23S rRNA (pseudouridine1915-N3)-methyltransferase